MTVTVARQVRPGRVDDFERWADKLTDEASQFPGFLGAGRLRPSEPGQDWHVVYRFASAADLHRWEQSAIRGDLLTQADELMETVAEQRVTGLESWFTLPGRAMPPPPKWKMFLVSGVVIYLLQLLEYSLFGFVTGQWPLPLRLLLMSFPVTAVMTWVVMPRASVMLRGWLFGAEAAQPLADK